MALSHAAQDVLRVLPDGSLVELDELPTKLSIAVPDTTILSAGTMDRMLQCFTYDVFAIVDFERSTVELTNTKATFKKMAPLNFQLTATTESEKIAVRFANRMDVIDFDFLVPELRISNTDECTLLHISKLLRISHHALADQLEESSTLQYNMDTQEIILTFPKTNKRKRS